MAEPIAVERYVWDKKKHCFVGAEITTELRHEGAEPRVTRRPGPRALFLKGPVPWSWIVKAATLRGKALVVGLCLWRLAGATKCWTVMLGNNELAPFSVDGSMKSRTLRALEGAGLMRLPLVTILTGET
jgi:hypothetical protein